jgi:transcription elongation factor Elf1
MNDIRNKTWYEPCPKCGRQPTEVKVYGSKEIYAVHCKSCKLHAQAEVSNDRGRNETLYNWNMLVEAIKNKML